MPKRMTGARSIQTEEEPATSLLFTQCSAGGKVDVVREVGGGRIARDRHCSRRNLSTACTVCSHCDRQPFKNAR